MSLKTRTFRPIKLPVKRQAMEELSNDHSQDNQSFQKNIVQKKQNLVAKLKKDDHDQEEDNIEFQGKINQQSLAMEIIKQGYVQSYIDFFYVTNHCMNDFLSQDILENEFKMESRDQSLFLNTEQSLNELKDVLIKAEDSSSKLQSLLFMLNDDDKCKYIRYPDKSVALEEYQNLALKFYEQHQDYLVASYFYKKVVEISKLCQNQMFEAQAKLGLGKCYDKLGKSEEAIEIFEVNLAECEKNYITDVIIMISQQLIEIYNKYATQCEEDDTGDIKEVLYYYEKCLEVAQKAADQASEGNICYKIGLLYFKFDDWEKSIEYQQKYLNNAQMFSSDQSKMKQMEAHASLSKSYLKLNNTANAQLHLERYHGLAKELRLNNAQSDAALNLAKLYQKKCNIPKSLEFYQQHFECARTEKSENGKSRDLIEQSRVIFGIAKANANIQNYIKIVQESETNIKPIIDWKLKKDK